jgi:hypothetical protein
MSAIDGLVLLAAELPDPGAPTFPMLCGSYGAFMAGMIGWLRRRSMGPYAAGGTVVGFGLGAVCWLTALAIDRL